MMMSSRRRNSLLRLLAIINFTGVTQCAGAADCKGTVRGAVATVVMEILQRLLHKAGNHGPNAGEVMGSISEAIMNRLKRILRPCDTLLLVLFAGLFLPVSAQSQELESLTATAKGHGRIASAIDDQEITAALVVLRQNGTALITVYADVQLQAEGTWSTNASSPEEILLKITGGVLKGEMTGSGKLLLTNDRKSIKELTINVTSTDGQKISVTFVADDSEGRVKGYEREAPSRTWLGLKEGTSSPRFAAGRAQM